MNQRQFEEIENRIREAAENASPPFSEENWEAMNLLLDKEFPEKRRRKIFFLWFWPLLGLSIAGAFLLFSTGNKTKISSVSKEKDHKIVYGKDVNVATNNEPKSAGPSLGSELDNTKGQAVIISQVNPSLTNANTTTASGNNVSGNTIKESGNKNNNNPINNNIVSGRSNSKGNLTLKHSNTLQRSNNDITGNTDVTSDNVAGRNRRPLAGRSPLSNMFVNDEGLDKVLKGMIPSLDIIRSSFFDGIHIPPFSIAMLTKSDMDADKNSVKKLSPSRISGFYLIAAGSFVNNSIDKISGKMSGGYGLGIGYQLNNKLSLQTGFYFGKKKYRADKYDYHFKDGSYFNTVDVVNIDADCYVYDIPLSLRYNIASGKKSAFYATAGLSSYIMKRETYDYTYLKNGMKHVAGITYTGNTHLFSVAGISAGYERKLTNNISILAEPFIKIPLAGVGEGKVKLHSTGLLLGIKYTLPHR